ncbi:enoyl-CoA hydratase-related protein [Pilimelia columellifera]|uniref:Enoyl-CoA hydratase-related protein n=1 Tax=Pilimelia columellifera subsp. columellifera TaxID=706583 RepID=A0ABN3NKK2_9ACTN
MKLLLLVSAFNGLTQRVWCELRAGGHDVGVQLATNDAAIINAVRRTNPDLILCPFLKDRVPEEVWRQRRTVIIHPGPVGDRGPSSLDWAITEGASHWGVTALEAIAEMDAGPIWAHRTFPMPAEPVRKSAIYNGPVADAALECAREVVAKAVDPTFQPTPLAEAVVAVPGARARPTMTQADRRFGWEENTDHILRRVRAADGAPGVRAQLAGLDVLVFDARRGGPVDAAPGQVVAVRDGAVRVATGDGSVWVGQLKTPAAVGGDVPRIKLPATALLGRRLRGVPRQAASLNGDADIRYHRDGAVGWLTIDVYNGAMGPATCRRLLSALRHAAGQDTRALVLVSGPEVFSNGIHLNLIEADRDPGALAWANIKAINAVCRAITTLRGQPVVAAFGGPAGAGGVMLALGADVVAARAGVVLNPYYEMGLFGSELHTYTLPRRVGETVARQLLDGRLPVTVEAAERMGLIDTVGPRPYPRFVEWLAELAERTAADGDRIRREKAARLAAAPMPLDAYAARELAEMSRDMFDNRSDFAGARTDFVHKVRATVTPAKLAFRSPGGLPRRRRSAPRPVGC